MRGIRFGEWGGNGRGGSAEGMAQLGWEGMCARVCVVGESGETQVGRDEWAG